MGYGGASNVGTSRAPGGPTTSCLGALPEAPVLSQLRAAQRIALEAQLALSQPPAANVSGLQD